jgi:hypothetical protein
MIRPLIAALTLVLTLASPAFAQTTRTPLSASAWTDICTAPCSVKAINGTAFFVLDITPPATLGASPIPWNPENGLLPNLATGVHVYGRGQTDGVAVSSIPSVAPGGGSGGGGGATTIADGADTAEGAKADTQATDDTGSWSVVAILKRISAALRGTLIALPPSIAPVRTAVSVAATSTQLVAAKTNRRAAQVTCDGTSAVGLSQTGATLTANTLAGGADTIIPANAANAYISPFATTTAITAYGTSTAQTCVVLEWIQ